VLLFVVFYAVAQIDKNKNPFDFANIEDGIYVTQSNGFCVSSVLIEIKDKYVIGIYKNSICEENKLNAIARFYDYTEVGYAKTFNAIENAPQGYGKCRTTSMAWKQDNQEEKYWLVLFGKKKDCWYSKK